MGDGVLGGNTGGLWAKVTPPPAPQSVVGSRQFLKIVTRDALRVTISSALRFFHQLKQGWVEGVFDVVYLFDSFYFEDGDDIEADFFAAVHFADIGVGSLD